MPYMSFKIQFSIIEVQFLLTMKTKQIKAVQ